MNLSNIGSHLRKKFADEETYQKYFRLVNERVTSHAIKIINTLTQAEAARLLNVPRWVIHRAIKDKEIPTNGLDGHDCRIDPDDCRVFALKWRARKARRN
jgi:excisionase family DNA binding protein